MNTSKRMCWVMENSDRAAVLLYEIKTDLGEAAGILDEIKRERSFQFLPICKCKQGELFSCLPNLPEENKALARLCLNSLVETL